MSGYVMPLANPGRTSWVPALPPQYGELRPAVPSSLAAALGPPVAVAVDRETRATVFHYAQGAVVSYGREHLGLAAATTRDSMLVAASRGVVVGDDLHPWAGGPARSLDPGAPPGRMLVCALLERDWITVRQNSADTTIDSITVRRTNLQGPLKSMMRTEPGFGCAAVSGDGIIAVALNSGRFVALNAGSLQERFELRRAEPIYLVSSMGNDWGVVSAEPNTDQSTPPVERRARVTGMPSYHIRGNWRSRAQRIDPGGGIVWQVDVPFPVLQPPIDAGGSRCYLAGKGLAAIDDGKVVWQKPANVRLPVTCFGNGALALAAGFQVRIVDHSGAQQQALTVRDRSRIVTMPTVGPDGELYVGTTTGFYVAR